MAEALDVSRIDEFDNAHVRASQAEGKKRTLSAAVRCHSVGSAAVVAEFNRLTARVIWTCA